MQVASSKPQTKQKHKPNYRQTGLPPHSTLCIRGKQSKKETNKQKMELENSAIVVGGFNV